MFKISQRIDSLRQLQDLSHDVIDLANRLYKTFLAGGTLYVIGNGGSASQAAHLTSELVGRYHLDRPPYAAIDLTSSVSALTCIANDYSYEQVFSRQIDALITNKDLLICLSTSGNSRNILQALVSAQSKGAYATAITGNKGDNQLAKACADSIIVPSSSTPIIQELTLVIIHCLCEHIDLLSTK